MNRSDAPRWLVLVVHLLPTRVRCPYIRAELLRSYRALKQVHSDPVDAWGELVEDPELAQRYKAQRGKGKLVRLGWDEVSEMTAAAYVYTIKKYGPARIVGFSPIPAMSQVFFSSGARFHRLIGGAMLSFYDWYADLPFLIELAKGEDGEYHPGKFVVAADLDVEESDTEHAVYKPVMFDRASDAVVVPPGTLGHRFSEDGVGRWNLDLGDIDPALTMMGHHDDVAEVLMPRFDTAGQGGRGDVRRGVPIKRVGDRVVTTVYDLLLAEYGVGREGLPGEWAKGLDDAEALYTPAWQEEITSVPGPAVARVAREFAQNALDSGGRSMIIMGAGTNHWFHSDTIYRTFLTLTNLCATQGVNGGGWAHYVGQEKVRPITGWMHLANALDWSRPPRQMTQTTYWYMHTSQWRYDQFGADTLTATTGAGKFAGTSTADAVALSARLGWQPFYPQFDVSSLEIPEQAQAAGQETVPYLVDKLKSGEINFAVEDPDAAHNHPRIWAVWRANTLGSRAKGEQYFLKHLLGVDNTVGAEEAPEEFRPKGSPKPERRGWEKVDFKHAHCCDHPCRGERVSPRRGSQGGSGGGGTASARPGVGRRRHV